MFANIQIFVMDFIQRFFIFVIIVVLLYYLFNRVILPLMIKRFVNKKQREFNVEEQNSDNMQDNNANRINKDKAIQDDFGDYTDYEELD